MSVIGEPVGKTVVEVGLNDTSLVRGLSNLNARMKLADNTWKSSLSTFKQSDRSIEKLSTSVKGMNDKLQIQTKIVDEHKRKVENLTKEYGENHTKVIKANAELVKQQGVYGNLKRSIGEMTDEMKQSSIEQKKVEGQQAKLLKQEQEMARSKATLQDKMKLVDAEWQNNLSKMKLAGNQYGQIEGKIKSLNDKMELQKKAVYAQAAEVRKLTKDYGENSEKAVKANIALKDQTKILNDLKDDIAATTKELQDFNKAEAIKNSPFTQRQKELEAYSSKLKSVGDKWTSTGQSMSLAVTAPLAGIGAMGVKTAMDFDAQMSRVGAISDTTGSKFEEMKRVAMELGASTTKSASEVAKGMEEMAAKGYDANQIMAAMPGIISAAEASGSDMTQTANVMASAMNAFGIEAGKSSHVADVLAQTANQSAADITDMEYALKYAAAPAKSLGMSLEETSASIGMMVDSGLKGEQAGTTLRGALLGLLDPSEKNAKLMNKMGVEVSDASGNFVGMEQLVRNLESSMEGMTDTQKAANLSQLVGKEAVSGMLVMMEQGPDKIGKMTKSLEESDGASQKASKAMMNNLKGAVEEMGGAFETVGIQIGQDMTPYIRELANGAQSLATKFSEMPGWARKTAVGIGLVAAATGPVIVGVGLVAKATGTAADGLARLSGKYAANTVAAEANATANMTAGKTLGKSAGPVGKLGGMFNVFGKNAGGATRSVGLLARGAGLLRAGIGLVTGPVGITLTAVTLLAAGFKLAYKHIGWFRTGVDNTGKLLKEIAPQMNFSWVGKIGTGFKKAGDGLGYVAKKGFELSPAGVAAKGFFGLVNQAVTKATDKTNVYGKGVSSSTETALKGYTNLSMKASKKLEELRMSNKKIGEKQYLEMMKLYADMSSGVLKKIAQRKQREVAGLRGIFSATRGLTNAEEQRILVKAQTGNSKEIQAVQLIQNDIKAIYTKARMERRALTKSEENKIVALQSQMDKKVVASLSKSEKEQRIILGRLKSNKSKLSLEAAAEVIKHSAKERNESIKNAKQKRDKVIDEAIYQRDVAKSISKKQADAIIKDAERQYKESKKNAEKQHNKVVNEAAAQNKGVTLHIDAQTGRVKSKWEEASGSVAKWSGKMLSKGVGSAFDMYKGVKKWNDETGKKVHDRWESITKNVGSFAGSMKKNAVDKFMGMYNGAKKWTDSIGSYISNAKEGMKTKAQNLGKSVANGAISGLNKMIGGINTISKAITKKNLMDKIPELHTGTRASSAIVRNGAIAQPTMAIVGDRGPGNGPGGYRREIIEKANGTKYLTPAKDTLVRLDKGDKVHSGRKTHAYMSRLPHFDKGTDKDDFWTNAKQFDIRGMAGNAMDGIGTLGKKFKETVGAVKAKAGDIIGDVMDYIKNPKALLDKVMGSMGIDFGGLGMTGTMAKLAYSKLKIMLQGKIKEWFESAGGGYNPFASWTKTAGRGWQKGGHAGIDYAMPAGTPVPSPITGEVIQSWFSPNQPSGGNEVQIFADGFTHILMHMLNGSRTVKKGDRVTAGQIIGKVGNTGNSFGDHLHWQVNKGRGYLYNEDSIDPEYWAKHYAKGKGNGIAGNAQSWASTIKRAAAKMNVDLTSRELKGIIAQINRESTGNEKVVQSSSVWDVNTASGNPAQGLLQYVPQTFRKYAVAGHENMRRGYDQLLAFFNNSNWRRDLPYGRSGWGPSGLRRFANGGIIQNETVIAGEEYPEMIIPLDPRKKHRARPLLAQANNIVNDDKLIKLSSGTTKSKSTRTHNIVWGDTLWDLARTFGTTVKELKRVNGLTSDMIYAGCKLLVPVKSAAKSTSKSSAVKRPQTTRVTNRAGILRGISNNLMRRSRTTNYSGLVKSYGDIGSLMSAGLKNIYKDSPETMLKNIQAVRAKVNSTIKADQAKIAANYAKARKSKGNKKVIADVRAENKAIQSQINYLNSVKRNEVLKSNVIENIVKKRSAISTQLAAKQGKYKTTLEEKASLNTSVRDAYKNYGGFGATSGNSTKDFISVMNYRYKRMLEFHNDLVKLRKLGLDPQILRELIEGGVENSYGKVKVLLRGGKSGIASINNMQRKINKLASDSGKSESGIIYDPSIISQAKQIKNLNNQKTGLAASSKKYMTGTKKVIPLPTAKKTQVANNATKAIVATAKRLNVVGKNDVYAQQLDRKIEQIKNDRNKSNDKVIADLQKELGKQSKNFDKIIDLMAKILDKNPNILMDGYKVSKQVDKHQATNAKTSARRKTSS
ncbi:phage tail tape measure protein [Macrococcus equipercicus]|uniref:lysostaphin n=1 Tax=Macrococcus equipercicus TaxID=69967 RepID=A0ABQ6R7P1_9STAP|nr:phage tail tape measure protein [Macrococcus equipercicus]KAA1039115.1 phage tail tape measure protein [Macrococcus equipercicus]